MHAYHSWPERPSADAGSLEGGSVAAPRPSAVQGADVVGGAPERCPETGPVPAALQQALPVGAVPSSQDQGICYVVVTTKTTTSCVVFFSEKTLV